MKVDIRLGHDLPLDQLLALYESVGWIEYINEKRGPELQDAIRNSTYVVSAWSDDTLVGLARVLSDDSSIFYLQDILVNPKFQRKGIGKQLMNNCMERFKHVRSRVLLTDDEEKQLQFYESFGFKNTRDLSKFQVNTFVLYEDMDWANKKE